MPFEYLIFNLIVISGPLILSFDKKVHYISYWNRVFAALTLTFIPFVAWDIIVTDRHWWFNPIHTLPLRIFGLPIEEILFFITIPFACIFIWLCLNAYFPVKRNNINIRANLIFYVFLIAGILLFSLGKEYSALVTITCGLSIFLDEKLSTKLYQFRNFYILLFIVTGLILIFNGYLTGRPIVLYDIQYQLDFRITTIPVEDFLYGISHIYLSIIAFEWLGKKND